MKRTLTIVLCTLVFYSAIGAIIFYTDKPNSVPTDSDFFSLQRNRDYINSSGLQMKGYLYSSPTFTGVTTVNGNLIVNGFFYGNGGGLTNIGGLNFLPITNGNGTNESFWGVTFFQELDVLNAYLTNLFTFYTNAQYTATDGNGKLIAGTGLPATNLLIAAGSNITFSTNSAGQITISGVATNGSSLTNISGGVIVGGTKTWQFDGSFLWPGDTLPATWTTNTPGAGSSSIQSAGPSIKAWQFSTSATNQVLLQVPMPADWDQSTVNVWINLVSGTNSAAANAITNTWGCSAARVGTALGTAILVTNNLPGGTALIETNVDFSTLTIAGSPKPGDYCLFQFQSRGGVTPFSATNTLLGVSFGMRYGVTNIQNNAIQWP